MENQLLAKRVKRIAELRGDFLLRSGIRSDRYFDKYQFESDPVLLKDIAEAMCNLVPKDIEVLAGLEMGGIPIAVMMGQILQLPTAFIRKEPKAYGTCRLAEGANLDGRRVLLVEDVVTSGGAIIDATNALRKEGIVLEDVVCVIERNGCGRLALRDCNLHLNSLLTQADLTDEK